MNELVLVRARLVASQSFVMMQKKSPSMISRSSTYSYYKMAITGMPKWSLVGPVWCHSVLFMWALPVLQSNDKSKRPAPWQNPLPQAIIVMDVECYLVNFLLFIWSTARSLWIQTLCTLCHSLKINGISKCVWNTSVLRNSSKFAKSVSHLGKLRC